MWMLAVNVFWVWLMAKWVRAIHREWRNLRLNAPYVEADIRVLEGQLRAAGVVL